MRHDRQGGAAAGDRADAHDAALGRGRVHVGDHVVAADGVEGDVRAAAGCFDDCPRERVDVEPAVGGTRRLDARIEAERPAPFELVGAASGADDARADGVRELQRGGADARPDRVHEQPFPGRDVGLRDDGVVDGDEDFGHAAHGDEIELRGNHRAVNGRDRDVLGLGATAGQPEHAITDRTRGHVRSDERDLAREFHAGNVGRPTGWRGITTRALQQIGAVQSRAVNAHDDLLGTRLRDRPIRHLQPAVYDRDRTHEPGN